MLFRFTKLWVALGLLLALWVMGAVRGSDPHTAIRPVGSRPGPVRIIQFYASVGTLTLGEKALLCYGVENAKSVRIAPISEEVYPSYNHCMEIGPLHTTHYTILAEGFDGRMAVKSFTLPVSTPPDTRNWKFAGRRERVVTEAIVVSAELPASPINAEAGRR
jgi:hypothetical protein